jgi:hypothetical protein
MIVNTPTTQLNKDFDLKTQTLSRLNFAKTNGNYSQRRFEQKMIEYHFS